MNQRFVQWSLFVAMALTLPAVHFLGLIAPLAAVAIVSVRLGVGGLVFGAVSVAFFGAIFLFVANLLSRGFKRIQTILLQRLAYAAVLVLLVSIAVVGPYGSGGHSNSRSLTWSQTFHPW